MNDFIELRTILTALQRRWWLLLLIPLLGGGIAYGVSRLQEPIYRATASLAIDQAIEANALKFSEIEAITQLIRTHADLAIRQPILEQVIKTLALPESWQQLQKRVRATALESSQVLEISVEAPTGEEAATIANQVAQQLVLFNSANTAQSARQTQSAFAESRMVELEQQIQAGQQQLATLKAIQASTAPTSSETDRWRFWLNPAGGTNPLDPTGERARRLNEEIGRLERLIVDWEKNYDRWKLTLQENRSFKTLTIVEPAQPSRTPIWPRPLINLILASGMGLVLALGLITLLEHFDNTIKLTDDLMPLVKAPVLGSIRRMKNAKHQLLLYQDDPAPAVEDYRVLHSKIQLMCTKLPKSILVTSPNARDGRSLTAANLGIVAAQFGYRTIVVDADWKSASQHELFRIPGNKGLQQLLFNPTEPGIPLWTIDRLPNLTVLTSGQAGGYTESDSGSGSATEWWRAKRLGQVLAQLTAHADLIIIDGPALLTAADATLLAGQVDGVILLAEANHTKRAALQEACFALERAQANLLGVVWNRAESQIAGALFSPPPAPSITAPSNLLTVTAAPLATSNNGGHALPQEAAPQEASDATRRRAVLPLRGAKSSGSNGIHHGAKHDALHGAKYGGSNGGKEGEERKRINTNGVHPPMPKQEKVITFEELGLEPLTLQGKVSTVNVPLILGDQALAAGDQVQLALVVWLDDAPSAPGNGVKRNAFLDVELNGATLGAITLEQSGAQTVPLLIPAAALTLSNGAHFLHLSLRSQEPHGPAPEMTVVVRSTSRLVLYTRQPLALMGG